MLKASISFVMSVHPPAWNSSAYEVIYLNIFQTSVEKIEVSLKSDKNNGCFTWWPLQIFGSVSLSSF